MRRGREGKEVGLSSRLRAAGRRGVEPRRPRDFGALCTPPPPAPSKPSSIDFSLHLYWRGELFLLPFSNYLLYELLLFTWRFRLLLQV